MKLNKVDFINKLRTFKKDYSIDYNAMIIKEIIIPDKNIFNLLTVAFKFSEEFSYCNNLIIMTFLIDKELNRYELEIVKNKY